MINTKLKGKLKWLNGRPLYCSMSGGKDSTALGLYLQERDIKFTPVFIDTGWEHPATYDYVRDVLTYEFGEPIVLRNERLYDEESSINGGMEQLVSRNHMFPNPITRFCTHELKLNPMRNFLTRKYIETKKKPINCVGVRAQESSARSKLGFVEEFDEGTVWRPLLEFSEEDVIALHNKYKVPPNPLYLKGYRRVGCYPCIYIRKEELRHLAYTNPERVEEISVIEQRVNKVRRDQGKKPSYFFHARIRSREAMDIHETVEWAKTKKGEVLDDVEEIENTGCMRWGLCEQAPTQQPSLFKDDA